MSLTTKEVQLKSRPDGIPAASDFEIVARKIPSPDDSQVLIQNIFMSVDPYMRGRMRDDFQLGAVMEGATVGKVIESRHPDFQVGDYVTHWKGWREHYLSDGKDLDKVDPDLAPLSAYLGVLGFPGLTAYGGLLTTGALQDGESVFVSAASGAVGSLVGQIAKIKGCTVVGSAGSDEKVTHLIEEFGFDHAFNYKTADIDAELTKALPRGIDVYFENVGGPQLEAALNHMRMYGRIPLCGMISMYNNGPTIAPGPKNLSAMIYKRVTMKGLVTPDYIDQQAQFREDVGQWIKDGKVKYKETIHQGIESAPQSFIELFSGGNEGKMLVQLAEQ
ncbi:putative oxidoreductase [marine gamma proteobacterium HTCC2143]|jgi:NADPH-dependent curcumin reductase CurA|uniref:Putative oxidoreductase n=1 Tax=marine gamma proteobacterium HTCC2143 TaxID=247633 RepID=A0YAD0_9GAMM|nr:putative oxidoreductase [marine gamma proteobacterium HTCC2143]